MANHATRLFGELRSIPRELRHHRPKVDSSGLVVEVGSGQSPHPAADVVVDMYVADDFERPAGYAMSFEKPLIVGDGQAIPLADGVASYSMAIHVLEHATDPVKFAAELSRIADAGFVQVPSRKSELTFGWAFHPWLIDLTDDGVLQFYPRKDERAPIGEQFHSDYENSILMQAWWAAHRSEWHHSVEWKGELPVVVHGDSAAEATSTFDLDATVQALSRATTPPLPATVLGALICPACSSPISISGSEAVCSACSLSYPVVGNVPVLVIGAASEVGVGAGSSLA